MYHVALLELPTVAHNPTTLQLTHGSQRHNINLINDSHSPVSKRRSINWHISPCQKQVPVYDNNSWAIIWTWWLIFSRPTLCQCSFFSATKRALNKRRISTHSLLSEEIGKQYYCGHRVNCKCRLRSSIKSVHHSMWKISILAAGTIAIVAG